MKLNPSPAKSATAAMTTTVGLALAVLVAAGLAGGFGPFAPPSAHAARAHANTRPNIVVIMTDDQRKDDMSVMPQTKRLIARKGATFDQFVASYSLCCPSRAAYLTGQYSHNNGVLSNSEALQGGYAALRDKGDTLPVWLEQAGYRTAHVGKYLNGYGAPANGGLHDVPPGWSTWDSAPWGSTYRMYDYSLNENGRLVHYGSKPRDYQTDVYAKLAAKFVDQRAGKKKPFFLSVAPLAPHVESIDGRNPTGLAAPRPAPRDRGTFKSLPFALENAPDYNEADVSDKPAWINSVPPWDTTQIQWARDSWRMRLESLQADDDLVGRVIGALRKTHQLANTYVFFTSDNGYLLGEHRLQGKNLHFQGSSLLPLLVRGPRIRAGERIGGLAANVDLAPTISALAGATPTRTVDGRSLKRELLDDRPVPASREVLFESFIDRGGGDLYGTGTHVGVRTARYSYVEYFNGEHELYDLSSDPYELQNVVDDPAYATVVQDLSQRVAALRDCSGGSCRT